MFRIQAIWTGVGLGTSYTNLHFGGSGAVQAQDAADRFTGWFGAVSTAINVQVLFTLNTEVVEITPSSGDPTAVWTVATYTQNGVEPTKRVPDVAQVLTRLSTGTFRGARRIRGRFNTPGVSETRNENGQVGAPTRSQFTNAAADHLIDPLDPTGLVVYSRPFAAIAGTGIAAPVVDAQTWDEWAMLGSRRT